MNEAFICDAVRTPIGRYGGALAMRPHRRSRCDADSRADRAQPRGRLERRRRRGVRLRQPGRRGQSQRGAHGAAARRSADRSARHDRQSPLRLEPRRRRHRRARDQVRRDVAGDRRRRREHVARAVRDGKGRFGVLARREDRGHDDRLALRQSGDESEIRHRQHAGDRRERRRRIRRRPRRSGCVRAAEPGARRRGDRRRPAGRGDRPGDAPREEGRPGRRHARRASARDDAGSARQAQGHRPRRTAR